MQEEAGSAAATGELRSEQGEEMQEGLAGSEGDYGVNGQGMYRDTLGYALWCLFFIGLGGVHRIYLGKYGTGILWMLTGGLFGIGQFVDLFRMKTLVRDANIRAGYLPHPHYARLLNHRRVPAAPLQSPMHQLLKAAMASGGAISVTQGVAATGLSFEEVQKTLSAMLESGYVDVENAPGSGVVLYRFVEIA